MSTAFIVLLLVAGLYVGWNIGANDAGNCVGTAVGSGLITFRRAVVLISVFAILGAVLQGEHVMKTIGTGIVAQVLPPQAILVVLLCSGLFVTLATFFRVPVSTSQAIVGGVAGVGYAAGAAVNTSKMITILECWVLCPVLTMALSFGIYWLLLAYLRRTKRADKVMRVLGALVVLSACYVAYSLGANNVGSAMGPIATQKVVDVRLLIAMGGVAMAVGAITFGQRVCETVGRNITPLDLPGALSAQVAAAFGIHLFSIFGIPVSTSQAIVGGVLGVGLVRGMRAVSKKKLGVIAAGWVLTPTMTGVVAFLIYGATRMVFGG
jgi:PiT family inorganic phosphate transporter